MLTVLTQEYLVTGVLDDVCITWLYSKLSKLMVSRTNYHFDDQDWTNSLENGLKPLVCYCFNLWHAVALVLFLVTQLKEKEVQECCTKVTLARIKEPPTSWPSRVEIHNSVHFISLSNSLWFPQSDMWAIFWHRQQPKAVPEPRDLLALLAHERQFIVHYVHTLGEHNSQTIAQHGEIHKELHNWTTPLTATIRTTVLVFWRLPCSIFTDMLANFCT